MWCNPAVLLPLPRLQVGYTSEALPPRTERHGLLSIAALRRQIASHFARSSQLPCCLRSLLQCSSATRLLVNWCNFFCGIVAFQS